MEIRFAHFRSTSPVSEDMKRRIICVTAYASGFSCPVSGAEPPLFAEMIAVDGCDAVSDVDLMNGSPGRLVNDADLNQFPVAFSGETEASVSVVQHAGKIFGHVVKRAVDMGSVFLAGMDDFAVLM